MRGERERWCGRVRRGAKRRHARAGRRAGRGGGDWVKECEAWGLWGGPDRIAPLRRKEVRLRRGNETGKDAEKRRSERPSEVGNGNGDAVKKRKKKGKK